MVFRVFFVLFGKPGSTQKNKKKLKVKKPLEKSLACESRIF